MTTVGGRIPVGEEERLSDRVRADEQNASRGASLVEAADVRSAALGVSQGNCKGDNGDPSQPPRISVDARIDNRQPSRKLHLSTSFQQYVDIDRWLLSYPQLKLEDLGPGFSTSHFTNGTGLRIATYAWRQSSPPPRAGVVLFHSFTAYTLFDFLRHQLPRGSCGDPTVEANSWIPMYPGSWVQTFYNQGFNVYSLDHQSHGRSEGWNGWRCNIEDFSHFVDDALHFIANVVLTDQSLPPEAPIVLFGFSMGGCITILTLRRIFSEDQFTSLRRRIHNAVLLAPLISLNMNRLSKVIMRINRSLIASCLPNMRFSVGSEDVCPYLEDWYGKDPYAYGGRVKSRMVAEIYKASIYTRKVINTLPADLRILCFQGSRDRTVDFRGPLVIFNSDVGMDLIYLSGWTHYLTKQHGSGKLMGLTATWIWRAINGKTSDQELELALEAEAECGVPVGKKRGSEGIGESISTRNEPNVKPTKNDIEMEVKPAGVIPNEEAST